MPPKVKACATAGKPIDLQIYDGQDQATAPPSEHSHPGRRTETSPVSHPWF